MSYSTRSLTATATGQTTATLTLAVTGANPPSFTWSISSGSGTKSPTSGSSGTSSLNQTILVTGLSPGTTYSWGYTLGGAAGSATGTSNSITTTTYTVTWNANGGSVSPASSSGVTVTAPTPTRTGYSFNGWYTAASGGTLAVSAGGSYTPSSNITLYAQWTANTYTVSYNANGGAGAPTSQTKTHDVTLTLSATTPTRTGYTFSSWNTAINGSGTSYSAGGSYTANAAVTLYAQWTANTYTISYNANGGIGAPTSQTKTHDVTLTLTSSTPTRSGYTFSSWNTAANGTGTYYASGASYTTNAAATLYAQWTINAPVWTDNTLATPVLGRVYSDGVSATNSPTYSVSSGTLPTGLSLNTSTGTVTGTPTAVGPFTFTITASNAGGSVSQSFTNIYPTGGLNTRGTSTWTDNKIQVYSGTAWVTETVWVYNGTTWVAAT